jgi:hypothetical protein
VALTEEKRNAIFDDNFAKGVADTGPTISQWDIFTPRPSLIVEAIRQYVI